jgi:hypothetical protein
MSVACVLTLKGVCRVHSIASLRVCNAKERKSSAKGKTSETAIGKTEPVQTGFVILKSGKMQTRSEASHGSDLSY